MPSDIQKFFTLAKQKTATFIKTTTQSSISPRLAWLLIAATGVAGQSLEEEPYEDYDKFYNVSNTTNTTKPAEAIQEDHSLAIVLISAVCICLCLRFCYGKCQLPLKHAQVDSVNGGDASWIALTPSSSSDLSRDP